MKKIIITLFVLPLALISQGKTETTNSIFNVLDYGAKGDGATLDHQAINRTIEACSMAGGGQVLLPAGTYLTGSIRLKSNVDLHLSAGATIMAAPSSMKAYDEAEPWLSRTRYLLS